MSATVVLVGTKALRFGARVTVRGLVAPWIGHNAASLPRYYAGRRPQSMVTLTLTERQLSADDGRPDTWPGSACSGSDSPWPGPLETHLRWRRFRVDPRPLRGVLLRVVTRTEGQFKAHQLTHPRRLQFAEVVIDTKPPRRILTDPADLIPGWGAAR